MLDHCSLDVSPILFLTSYQLTKNTKTATGTEEMVKYLAVLAAITEGLGSVHHTHMADHNYKYSSKGFNPLFYSLQALHACSKYSSKQAHAYTFKINIF